MRTGCVSRGFTDLLYKSHSITRIYDEGLNEEGCKMLSMFEILVQSSRSDRCCIYMYVAPAHGSTSMYDFKRSSRPKNFNKTSWQITEYLSRRE